jgi:hypothetical protein
MRSTFAAGGQPSANERGSEAGVAIRASAEHRYRARHIEITCGVHYRKRRQRRPTDHARSATSVHRNADAVTSARSGRGACEKLRHRSTRSGSTSAYLEYG